MFRYISTHQGINCRGTFFRDGYYNLSVARQYLSNQAFDKKEKIIWLTIVERNTLYIRCLDGKNLTSGKARGRIGQIELEVADPIKCFVIQKLHRIGSLFL